MVTAKYKKILAVAAFVGAFCFFLNTASHAFAATATILPSTRGSDTTGDALTDLTGDDATCNPDTTTAVATGDGCYTVDKGKEMLITGYDTSAIPAGATITAAVLHYQYGAENGYTGTNYLKYNTTTSGLSITDITGWSTDQTVDIYAGGVTTLSGLSNLQVEFLNNDGGSASAIEFDYAYVTVTYTPPTLTISGTANGNSGATVKVAYNSSVQAQSTTISGGTWSITGLTMPNGGDTITVWIDNVADANESTAVTIYSSGTTVTGMVLNTNVLTIGADSPNYSFWGSLSGIAGTYSCANDEDVMYSYASSTFNVQGTSCAGSVSNSYTGETFSQVGGGGVTVANGETLNTEKVNIGSNTTFTLASTSTVNLAGTSGTLITNSGTITANTSTVNVTGAGTTTLLSGATTLNNLTINNASAAVTTGSNLTVGGTLTITAGSLDLGSSNLTVTGATSITGTLADSNTGGTNLFTGAVTINAGGIWNSSVAEDFEFRGNLTNNSSAGFTSGSGIYKFTTNAQTLSGSQPFTITNVYNEITAGNGLTFSGQYPTMGTLRENMVNGVITFSGTVPTVTTFDAVQTIINTNTVQYTSSGAQTIIPTSYWDLTINKSAGTATLGGSGLDVWNNFTVTAGTFDANNNSFTAWAFVSSNSNTRAITMGSGTWGIYGTGTVWDTTTTTGLTVTPGTSTIKITDNSSNRKTFSGGGKTYNNIWFAPAGGTGDLEILGSNTFADFKDNGSAGHTILFTQGTTTTVSSFTVSGTNASNLITIRSGNGSGGVSASTHTLTMTGSSTIVSSDYLYLINSTATGGGGWYAGANSTDGGGNSGWTFTAPVTGCTSTATGNWNTAGTWTCGHVPGSSENVTIASGHTVTMDVNSATLGAITVNGTLTTSGSNYSLTGTGLTVASTGTLTANGSTITLTGTGGSVLVNSGTFTAGTSTVAFTGDGATTIPAVSYYNLSLSPTITVARTYTLNTTTVTGNLTINPTASSALGLTVNMGANLVVTGTTTVKSTSSATATLDAISGSNYNLTTGYLDIESGGTYTPQASTVTLSGSGGAYNYSSKWGSYGTGNGQFDFASGIARDSSGNIYVVDANNNRIQKFDASGTYITKWGTLGSGNGQLNTPLGIAVDTSGNVYVADYGNNRIQKFDSSGTYITQWGTSGTGNSQFSSPQGIAVDSSGNVYVVDTGNNRIQKFNAYGTYTTQWGSSGTGNGQFTSPLGIAVDSSGNVYVVDQGNARVEKFDSFGTYITQWGSSGSGNGQFSVAKGIGIDTNGNVYVVDSGNNRVQEFTSGGTYITQWGSSGSGNGQFNGAYGIVSDSSNTIYVTESSGDRVQKFNQAQQVVYVADSGNNRVQLFDSSGNYLSSFGSSGSGNGQFSGPNNVIVDSSGNIYVLDPGNNRIQKFDSSGNYVTQFGSGYLDNPGAMNIDTSGNIYMRNYWDTLIAKFNSSGTFQTSFNTQNGGHAIAINSTGTYYVPDINCYIFTYNSSGTYLGYLPDGSGSCGSGNTQINGDSHGITVDTSGNIYLADSGNYRVKKLDSSGNYVSQFGSSGSGDGQFGSGGPAQIALDSSGNIYVADPGNNRIQKFNSSGTFVTKWGTSGSGNGQFSGPTGVAVATSNVATSLFTLNGGTFTAGGSTVTTTGKGDMSLFTGSSTPSFNNLTLSSVGTVALSGTLTVGGNLTIGSSAILKSSGNDITVTGTLTNNGTLTINTGTPTITVAGTSFTNTGTVNDNQGTIKLTNATSNGKTFAGGGATYNKVWFAPGSGTGNFTISGNNTFGELKDDGSVAHTIFFTAGSTQTITNTWSINGTSGNLISLDSTSTGTYSLVKQNGQAKGDYLDIQHSVATPVAMWYAGDNSVNHQSTATAGSGWIFTTVHKHHGGGTVRNAGGETDNGTGSGDCADGVQNGNETGIDSGGRCANTGGSTGGGGGTAGGETTGSGTTQTGGSTGGGSGDTGFLFEPMHYLATAVTSVPNWNFLIVFQQFITTALAK